MKKCVKCNKVFSDDAVFCDECGEKLVPVEDQKQDTAQAPRPDSDKGTPMYCPNCGCKIDKDADFCPECGHNIKTDIQSGNGTAASRNKKGGKVVGIIVGAVAAVILVIVGAVLLIGGSGASLDHIFYAKNGAVYMTNGKEEDSVKIIKDAEDIYDEGEMESRISVLENANIIIFPDKYDYDAESFSLYFCSLKNPDEDVEKIDSDVIKYSVTKDEKKIVYRNSEDTLYLYDYKSKEKQKVANNVSTYRISRDGSQVFFVSDNTLYLTNMEEDNRIKISDNVSSVLLSDLGEESYNNVLVNDNGEFTDIYFAASEIVDGGTTRYNLYQYNVAADDKKKVADDVKMAKVYKDGSLYYFVCNVVTRPLADYVNDDLGAAGTLPEPVEPEEPKEPDFYTYDDIDKYDKAYKKYEKAYKKYEEEYEKYEEAYNAYVMQNDADLLRQDITEQTYSHNEYVLYYYDQTNTTEVLRTNTQIALPVFLSGAEKSSAVILGSVYQFDTPAKINLSSVEDCDDIIYELDDVYGQAEGIYSDITAADYFICGATATPLEAKEYISCAVSDKGDFITILTAQGDLIQREIKDGALQEEVVYDTDVSEYAYIDETTRDIYYMKKDELFCNKEKLDDDVVSSQTYYVDGKFYYLTDYSENNNVGTLVVSDGKNAENIAYDVNFIVSHEDGVIIYVTDYNADRENCTLNIWNGKEAERIADDVWDYQYLLPDRIYYITDYKDEEGDLYLKKGDDEIELDHNVNGFVNPDVF